MAQYYNMKWDNHITNMTRVLKHFLLNETFCDVTLACEGSSLKAHKIILSAGSSYFQSLLLENPCKHPIVILKDMHYMELKVILDFMYCGQAIVAENQLHELKRIADALEVKGFDEAVLERCQPGDRPALSRSVQPSPRRRKRRRRTSTSALSDNIDDGASGESKKSDSDVELLHIIHKESPSSPIENTDEPSNLQDQTAENIPMQSSRSSENITNNGNQQPKFSSDRDIPEGVEPVELPSGNLNSGHEIDVNQVNGYDSDVEFIHSDCDIVLIPRSRRKRKPKRDAGKDIVPAEEIGVKPDKLVEKISTTDHTPMLLEDQIPTEDQPAKQCPDKKSLIPNEFGIESSKIEEENLTTDDTTMPFEGQIPTEDQPDEQSPDKKCLVPYEIESSETEEKNVSDDVSTSCAGRSFTDIADQQLECSSDSTPIDLDQSSTENVCLKGLVEVTNKNYEKSLAIANQQPECSPDDVYDAQAPNINAEDELPPAKRRKKTFQNGTSDESDDEDRVLTENNMSNESDDEDTVQKENHTISDESDDEESVQKENNLISDESDAEDSVQKENHMNDEKEFFQEGKILD